MQFVRFRRCYSYSSVFASSIVLQGAVAYWRALVFWGPLVGCFPRVCTLIAYCFPEVTHKLFAASLRDRVQLVLGGLSVSVEDSFHALQVDLVILQPLLEDSLRAVPLDSLTCCSGRFFAASRSHHLPWRLGSRTRTDHVVTYEGIPTLGSGEQLKMREPLLLDSQPKGVQKQSVDVPLSLSLSLSFTPSLFLCYSLPIRPVFYISVLLLFSCVCFCFLHFPCSSRSLVLFLSLVFSVIFSLFPSFPHHLVIYFSLRSVVLSFSLPLPLLPSFSLSLFLPASVPPLLARRVCLIARTCDVLTLTGVAASLPGPVMSLNPEAWLPHRLKLGCPHHQDLPLLLFTPFSLVPLFGLPPHLFASDENGAVHLAESSSSCLFPRLFRRTADSPIWFMLLLATPRLPWPLKRCLSEPCSAASPRLLY